VAKAEKKIDSSDSVKVIVTTPADYQPVCRGFYQVEEDSLYVPFYPGGSFFSFLDSPQVAFDIDRTGRLLFIQVHVPRHGWLTRDDLVPPVTKEAAELHLRGFREKLPAARLETPPDRSWLRIVFADDSTARPCIIAENLICEILDRRSLAAVWVMSIEDDRAARGMAAWRGLVADEFRKRASDPRFTRIEIQR
jgi:hypothetical protein